jgi:outer membrane protein assembly factor BamE (lipoprotein component of BamABCDE complex)
LLPIGEEFRHGYVIDEAAVAQVKPGISAEQVLQLLGTPSTGRPARRRSRRAPP